MTNSNKQQGATSVSILTVGHGNHPQERFVALLKQHGVEVLVDVRSSPWSRWPQFVQQPLRHTLEAAGVRYVFLGEALGGKPSESAMYDDEGHVLYGRVAATVRFARGIEQLEQSMAESRVAVMCSEEDPGGCHRRLLVGRVLGERGARVSHIRGNGRLESEHEVAKRAESAKPSLFDEPAWRSVHPVMRTASSRRR